MKIAIALNRCAKCLLSIWFWNYHCVSECVVTCKFSADTISEPRAFSSTAVSWSIAFLLSVQFSSFQVIHCKYHRCNFHSKHTHSLTLIFGHFRSRCSLIAFHIILTYRTCFRTWFGMHTLYHHHGSKRKFIISTANYTSVLLLLSSSKRWVFTLKIECVQLWCWDLLRYNVKRKVYIGVMDDARCTLQ